MNKNILISRAFIIYKKKIEKMLKIKTIRINIKKKNN